MNGKKMTNYFSFHIFVLGAMLVFAADVAPVWGKPKLVEGFENIRHIRVTDGKLAVVKANNAVTQGYQAVRIPPGAKVHLSIAGNDLRDSHWLRIDTTTVAPIPHAVQLRFKSDAFNVYLAAYVQPGADTLALPLCMAKYRAGREWPKSRVEFTLDNRGKTALIVDNVRLDFAAEPPAGSILTDFGGERQFVWPGFRAGKSDNDRIQWGDSRWRSGWRVYWPDPLTEDFVGRYINDSAYRGQSPRRNLIDSISIDNRARDMSVWMWVTHYGFGYTQPISYSVRTGRRYLLKHHLKSRKDMFGPRGLLAGMQGRWTPKWFDEEYASRFYDIVRFRIKTPGQKVVMENCQLAAMVMTPFSSEAKMEAYLKIVQKDISRYRRQFILGYVKKARCRLVPTESEKNTGIMVFSPPPDDAFSATWVPTEIERAVTIKVAVGDGADFIIPLAMVPLQDIRSIKMSFSRFKTDKAHPLSFDAGGIKPIFFKRIPRVSNARVSFLPWIQSPKSGLVKQGEVVFVALRGRVRTSTASGVYRGKMKLAISGKSGELPIPIEIKVVKFPVSSVRGGFVGGLTSGSYKGFYRDYAWSLSPVKRVLATAKIRRQLLLEGLDSLRLKSVAIESSKKIQGKEFKINLKNYPSNLARGVTLLGVQELLRKIFRGDGQEKRVALAALQHTVKAAKRGGLRRYYLMCRMRRKSFEQFGRSAGGRIAEAGAAGMLRISAHTLANLPERGVVHSLRPWTAMLIDTDHHSTAKWISEFKAQNKKKTAYIHIQQADRFLTGFYSCAVGADGCYVSGVILRRGGTYNGCNVDGRGMLAVQSDGTLAPTMAMLRIRQGKSDYRLMKRCEKLLEKAQKNNTPADELDSALMKIMSRIQRHSGGVWFSQAHLRTTVASPSEIHSWRKNLLQSAEKVISRMK